MNSQNLCYKAILNAKGSFMKQTKVRLSFDIPLNEHTILKSECAQARIPIKDFLQELVLKGIRELKKQQLNERLKKSVQEAQDGKIKSRGSFAKYTDDEV